jgi:predicted MFS family arabinose efflux permease
VGLPAVDPTAVRWALVTGLPLTAVALIPLAFMHERAPQHVASVKDFVMLRNIVNLDVIVKLAGLSVLTGVAFGMTIRFFNVFFEQSYKASDGEIGTVLGLGSIAGAGAILLSPVLAQTFGKARSVFISQAASLPFLLLMAAAPSLQFATGFFLLRGTLYSLAQPLRNQLNMEFVGPQERGTTAGFTHTAFDLGGGLGAWIFAAILGDGGFASAFLTAAVLILVPAVLYYKFFDGMERNARAEQLAPAEGVPA